MKRKLNSTDVIDALTDLFILRGPPAFVRSDNGPEFVARTVRRWIEAVGAKTVFIEPGNPWENGYVESFNARFRAELLKRELFYSLKEAQIIIEGWRKHYKTKRPHSTLGYRPPAPETIVSMDQRPVMHVWMPPCVQEDFEQLEHVIGCGHVSGLLMRHRLRGRRPVWRCADQVQFTNASFCALCMRMVFPVRIWSIHCPYSSLISSHADSVSAGLRVHFAHAATIGFR